LVLGSVDRRTGEIRPADKANVQRAIRDAIKAGWLAESSSALCLVVPGHAIEGGVGGKPDEPCSRHARKGTRRPALTVVPDAAAEAGVSQ
jgi:hypothetical protein